MEFDDSSRWHLLRAALAAAGGLVTWAAGPWFAAPLWILALFASISSAIRTAPFPPVPVAVSPADGKVVAVKPESATLNRISIFLNIFDVHVNRTPIAGAIAKCSTRKASSTWPAAKSVPTERAERRHRRRATARRWSSNRSRDLIARRIVFSKKPGDRVAAGERVGLIKFGSRVDVLFGPEWEIVVQPGHARRGRLERDRAARRRDRGRIA